MRHCYFAEDSGNMGIVILLMTLGMIIALLFC
jgi:hypothetical protein